MTNKLETINSFSEALTTLSEAFRQGFVWPNLDMLLDNLADEIREIREVEHNAEGRERLIEEIGDLLHGSVELCRFLGLDPQEVLFKAHHKFKRRFEKLEEIHQSESQRPLKELDYPEQYELWKRAKKAV